MKYAKPPLDLDAQVALHDRETSGDFALMKRRLDSVSNYRLSGHWYPFRLPDESFKPRTRFETDWLRCPIWRECSMSCLVSVGFEAQSRTRIVDRVHRKISYEDADVARFRASVGLKNVETHQYVLPPERHVGAEEVEEDGEPFEVKMPKLVTKPQEPFGEGRRLAGAVEKNLRGLADGF